MKRALPFLLLLAGCHGDSVSPIQNESAALDARIHARYLLVHWPNGGPDFVREYDNELHCDNARRQLLREASDEINVTDATNEVRRHGTSPPLPIPPSPIAVCLVE